MLFLKLAWRNIFRNKRRTFIAGLAIGIGLAALIFVDATTIGMERTMVYSATASFLGEGQIHRRGFRSTFEPDKTINDLDSVVAGLKRSPIVEVFTERVYAYSMINSPSDVSSVTMVGVHPATEKKLSQIDDAITQGQFFAGDNERDIVMGYKLADILRVGLGDRVVLTVAQAHTGELAQEMFRVSGIYHFNTAEMDRGMVFVRLNVAQRMLDIDGQVQEIAIKFTNVSYGSDESLPFWSEFSQHDNEALGWTKLLPQLKATFELTKFSVLLVGIILFGVVALGIINTLFMSLYERMYEFGVMRAVGTRPLSVARLVVLEAGALSVISGILGIILGFIVCLIISYTGINYTGIEYSGVTFREPLYPVMKVSQYIIYPIVVCVLTMLVGLYPAMYAARLTPSDAMRRSL